MARGKKQAYKPDYFASKGGTHETFGMIYDSLMKSEQFKELPLYARYIYVACRNQINSKSCRETLYNHGKESGIDYPDNCFVFPAKQQKEYGFNDRSNFSKGMKELIEAGFIKLYENNRYTWNVNVYQFSSAWKD